MTECEHKWTARLRWTPHKADRVDPQGYVLDMIDQCKLCGEIEHRDHAITAEGKRLVVSGIAET